MEITAKEFIFNSTNGKSRFATYGDSTISAYSKNGYSDVQLYKDRDTFLSFTVIQISDSSFIILNITGHDNWLLYDILEENKIEKDERNCFPIESNEDLEWIFEELIDFCKESRYWNW